MLPLRARRLVVLLAALTTLLLTGCASISTTSGPTGVGGQNRVWAFTPAAQLLAPPTTSQSSCSRPDSTASAVGMASGFCVATEGIPDAAAIVRGGQSEMPASGELFSGAHGQSLEEAAAGVPHGTIRSTTAGEIRASGGSVEYAPEYNDRVGAWNYQHVNVTTGAGSSPFSDPFASPVPKSGRFGGPSYPFGGPDYPYGP